MCHPDIGAAITVTDSISDWTHDIHAGDAVETLREMPESSVHMCMTSPPYFGLRDYGADGQIGLEDSLDEYVAELVEVGDALRRVLRDDGSWWLNLGDSYAGDKNKMLVPHRVAIALQDAGWVVRNDVTWVKPNPMPSSVKDRLNTTTEQIFHLTPEPDYWFDLDAIREDHAETSVERAESDAPMKLEAQEDYADATPISGGDGTGNLNPAGKNPGDVFEVTTKPFPEAHFAVYPPELCRKPIKATAPPKTCADCGAPYERETEQTPLWARDKSEVSRPQLKRALEIYEKSDLTTDHLKAVRAHGQKDSPGNKAERLDDVEMQGLAQEAKDVLSGYFIEFTRSPDSEHTGWTATCDCDTDETEPGIVLDPFAGAGTTCLVAKDLGRRFVGVDLNSEYVALAQKRVGVTVDEPERLLEDEETTIQAFADGGDAE